MCMCMCVHVAYLALICVRLYHTINLSFSRYTWSTYIYIMLWINTCQSIGGILVVYRNTSNLQNIEISIRKAAYPSPFYPQLPLTTCHHQKISEMNIEYMSILRKTPNTSERYVSPVPHVLKPFSCPLDTI